MPVLRDIIPTRRVNPTLNPTGSNWTEHKPDLKEDFNSHCGYCYSYDGYRHTYFEVDHFVPKKEIKKNAWAISLTQYSNLVYSCKFCNNKKLSKWTTNSPDPSHDRSTGFVDPCDPNYDTHFYRTANGAIRPQTTLGQWMFSEAFKFDEREQSIIVLWNMNRLRQIIDALIVQLNSHASGSADYNTIKLKLGEYTLEYYMFHKELMEFYEQ
jgi:HNH endonuclease